MGIMKEEYELLIDTFNTLPGVEVTGCVLDKSFEQIKSGWGGPLIFLHISEKEQEGLFFLTRVLDKRYFQHGHVWRIELTCGDTPYKNGDRPITYQIFRPLTGIESEESLLQETRDLIDNMSYHFNHDGFMTGYNMDKERYRLGRLQYTNQAWKRKNNLENLGI